MRKLNKSKWAALVMYIVIFAIMLYCNAHTHYLVDDYQYMLSFETDERITSVWEIFPSMAAHAQTMNGRLVAHTFAQFFLMIPKGYFNVVNSLMFVLLMMLMCRIGSDGQRNNYIIAGVFSAVWLFTPAFGQVFLWLDGACNYLWAAVFCLAFITPYINSYLHDRQLKGVKRWLFPVLAFAAGAYSENTSIAALVIVGVLQLLELVQQHKKLDLYKVICTLVAAFGYGTIYMAPAQWINKSVELTPEVYWQNMKTLVEKHQGFAILLGVFAVLFVLNVFCNTDRKRIWLAVVLAIGSVCANLILVVAAEYPDRSALPVCIYTVTAIAVLAGGLRGQYKMITTAIVAWAMVMASFQVYLGLDDIAVTYADMLENEQKIIASAAIGEPYSKIPPLEASTKYSALYKQLYVSFDPDTWPNKQMAKYYGATRVVAWIEDE